MNLSKILNKKEVKLLLNNGVVIEGFIKEWQDNELLVYSENGNETIVFSPKTNIVAIKIINGSEENKISSKEEKMTDLEEKFEQTYNEPSENNDLRVKNLSDLRVELLKQEKKIISDKLKDHNIGSIKTVQYSSPLSILKKKD